MPTSCSACRSTRATTPSRPPSSPSSASGPSRLLTNNPHKVDGLRAAGIDVTASSRSPRLPTTATSATSPPRRCAWITCGRPGCPWQSPTMSNPRSTRWRCSATFDRVLTAHSSCSSTRRRSTVASPPRPATHDGSARRRNDDCRMRCGPRVTACSWGSEPWCATTRNSRFGWCPGHRRCGPCSTRPCESRPPPRSSVRARRPR